MLRSTGACVRKKLAAQHAGQTLASEGRYGEDVIEADQAAFGCHLPTSSELAIDSQLKRTERHGRIQQPLGLGLSLRQGRAAKCTHRLRKRLKSDCK